MGGAYGNNPPWSSECAGENCFMSDGSGYTFYWNCNCVPNGASNDFINTEVCGGVGYTNPASW